MSNEQTAINIPAIVEADESAETDSSLGDDIASSTASLRSSILEFRHENGRSYHSYKAGKYVLPNDEEEMDRLDLQHHLFLMTFGNKLYCAPVDEQTPLLNVLDVGTGTGIWALDFADAHPQSNVIGVDLSPIQPGYTAPNLLFQIDDLEEQWTFSTKFDFVYGRMMSGSFGNWPGFFAQCFENLAPGGYLELADAGVQLDADDDSMPEGSTLSEWGKLLVESSTKLGRPLTTEAGPLVQGMKDAGFVDVQALRYKWPTNKWPKDKQFKDLGMWCQANIGGNLAGLCQALFTRGLGWSMEELELYLVDVRKALKDPSVHAYFPLIVVYGRKPK